MASALVARRLRFSASGVVFTDGSDVFGQHRLLATGTDSRDAEVQKYGIALPASPLPDALLLLDEDVFACRFTAKANALIFLVAVAVGV